MSMLRQAFRANLLPALILWGFAVALLVLYYLHVPTHQALMLLAQFKNRLGLGFSMPAQAIAGALLPFLFQRIQRGDHRKTAWVHVPYLMVFCAFQGALIDSFYAFQAVIFGNNERLATILSKVAFDTLLFTPIISMPLAVLAFDFKNAGFSVARTLQPLGKAWYLSRVLPVYGAALLVWTPAIAVIYALPLALQYPIQAVVSCFWGLILVIMTSKK